MHYTVQHYAFLYYLKLVPQETKHVINSLYYDVLMDSAKLVTYCLIQLSVIPIPTKTNNLF